MTHDKLKKVLDLHPKWLKGEPGGQRADLREADLRKANLREANLREANLRDADLSYADLIGANLFRADLLRADLNGADLSGADLSGADLRETDLSGANLREVNLHGTKLLRSNLIGVKGLITFGPTRKNGRMIYAVWHNTEWMIQDGLFWGDLKSLKKSVEKDPFYKGIINLLKKYKPI